MDNQMVLSPIAVGEFMELIGDVVKRVLEGVVGHSEETSSVSEDGRLWSRKEAAAYLGVSLVTLNSWTKSGKIPAHRIGKHVRYRESELNQSLQRVQVLPTAYRQAS